MNERFRLAFGQAERELLEPRRFSSQTELRHCKNVTSKLVQEALDMWADLWSEFQDRVTCGVMVLPQADRGFKPQCGWPEFLEKMWQLKFYLDSVKRFCEQSS